MNNTQLYSILCDYCCSNKPEVIRKFLEQHPEIDLIQKEGKLFRIAISYQFNKVLDVLLEYYAKAKLKSQDVGTYEYKFAKHNVRDIIQDAIDAYDISPEAKKIIDNYEIFSEVPEEPDNSSDLEEDIMSLDEYDGYHHKIALIGILETQTTEEIDII